jgi:DNA-binding MarR family transcriptional regulator
MRRIFIYTTVPFFSIDCVYTARLKEFQLKSGRSKIVFKELDPILHSQLRLAVISLLINIKEAEFIFLKDKTGATAGNLSVQVQKLKDAGYIDVTKQFKDNYPQTVCKITPAGINAFEQYAKNLQQYLKP